MRETILNKATSMFLSLGFKSVTMDDIAAAVGISKKTIYLHFENKTSLVEAVTRQLFERISAGIDAICAFEKSPIEEIFSIRKYLIQHFSHDDAASFYQLQKFFPECYAILRKRQFEKMHGGMSKNLVRGIEQGYYRSDLDVSFTSRIYFTGLSGIKDTDIFPSEMFRPEELTLKFLEHYLRSIVTQKGMDALYDILENDVTHLIKF